MEVVPTEIVPMELPYLATYALVNGCIHPVLSSDIIQLVKNTTDQITFFTYTFDMTHQNKPLHTVLTEVNDS